WAYCLSRGRQGGGDELSSVRCMFFLPTWAAESVRKPSFQQRDLCRVYSSSGADRREEYFAGSEWSSSGACRIDRAVGLRRTGFGGEWSKGRRYDGGDWSGSYRADVYACGGARGCQSDCRCEAGGSDRHSKAVWR